MKVILKVAVVAMLIGATGCVTTEKVSINQLGDENLTCAELKAQDAKLNDVSQQAATNKGVNKANVAAVLLFWPAAVGNYMDADTAEKLIAQRRTKLAGLYTSKRCGR